MWIRAFSLSFEAQIVFGQKIMGNQKCSFFCLQWRTRKSIDPETSLEEKNWLIDLLSIES